MHLDIPGTIWNHEILSSSSAVQQCSCWSITPVFRSTCSIPVEVIFFSRLITVLHCPTSIHNCEGHYVAISCSVHIRGHLHIIIIIMVNHLCQHFSCSWGIHGSPDPSLQVVHRRLLCASWCNLHGYWSPKGILCIGRRKSKDWVEEHTGGRGGAMCVCVRGVGDYQGSPACVSEKIVRCLVR